MKLMTVDKETHSSLQIPVVYIETESFPNNIETNQRYQIVFIENGTGILKIGNRREIFIAPVLFCFNENEEPVLEQSSNLNARSVCFHPSYINSIFTFENVRVGSDQFNETDIHDRYWIRPFFQRNEFNGRFCLNSVIAKKVSQILNGIRKELLGQSDYFWKCRSRSFLIELLFLMQQVHMTPELIEGVIGGNYSEDIGKILLFLYSKYNERITIELLTKEFNINRTTLSEKFAKEVGQPIMTFLIKFRVTLSANILRDTTIPVSEVMEKMGFNDATHFMRMFRKHMGCSPSNYRQRNCLLLR